MHVYIYKILQDENTLWESDNFLKNLRIEDYRCQNVNCRLGNADFGFGIMD